MAQSTSGRIKAPKRWEMLNRFVDVGGTDLRANDWRVWMVLFRDAQGDTAQVSQSYIASRLGVDRKTVGRAVKRLKEAGLLEVLRRGGVRRGLSIYRLHSESFVNVPEEGH